MSALCQRLMYFKPVLSGKAGIYERNPTDLIKRTATLCRFCSKSTNGNEVEQSFTRPGKTAGTRPENRLTNFHKRLLYTSGKYTSMAACPDYVGATELRNAIDVCKTLFNIWCMMFLAFFFIFVHIIEKRRLRRTFARLERKEQRNMIEFDKKNVEIMERRKLQQLQAKAA